MKLSKHFEKRRDELAKVDRNFYDLRDADIRERWFKKGYDSAYADLMKEVQPLIDAIEHSTAIVDDYGDSGISKPIRKALADWQKKFGSIK